MHTQPAQHSYRAIFIPPGVDAQDAEAKHLQGTLPGLNLAAVNNDSAALLGHQLTGWPVIDTVRMDPALPAEQCRVFKVDGGKPVNFTPFVEANADDELVCAWAKRCKVGEEREFGTGAFGRVKVRRLA